MAQLTRSVGECCDHTSHRLSKAAGAPPRCSQRAPQEGGTARRRPSINTLRQFVRPTRWRRYQGGKGERDWDDPTVDPSSGPRMGTLHSTFAAFSNRLALEGWESKDAVVNSRPAASQLSLPKAARCLRANAQRRSHPWQMFLPDHNITLERSGWVHKFVALAVTSKRAYPPSSVEVRLSFDFHSGHAKI